MNKAEILVIDDEPQMRRLLQITLESNDFKVWMVATGKEGLIMAANHPPELILLDLGLPDISGQTVLKELKTWFYKPVIIISVHDDEESIIEALDNGASDYLTKPYRTGELLARIRSNLRRMLPENQDQLIIVEDLEIDFKARIIRKKGAPIKLTSTEYNLMALFVKNQGRVMTHQYILNEIWGVGYQSETQYLRVFVAQLRKKIEDNPNKPRYIVTESRVGYRFS